MSSRSADIGYRTHANILLICQRLDLGEDLAPHWVAVIAHKDQFERFGPLFWQ